MEEDIVLYIPGFPPSVNNYYGHTKTGIMYLKKSGNAYRDVVAKSVTEQHAKDIICGQRIWVEVVLHPPDQRIRDLGNYDKCLMDALTHAGVWDDDSQIDQQMLLRGVPIRGGMVKIKMGPAGPIIPIDWN